MKTILVILGTRPEAIKLAPVILKLRSMPQFRVLVCNTEQQKELSRQTLGFFGIEADFALDVMRPNQSLAGVQSRLLDALSALYAEHQIDATIVQGDTMTVFCGALVSFYSRVPVFHVEAGLRSYDLFEPFPEEAIRCMASRITDLHFAPTPMASEALRKEGIAEKGIRMTGNTVIDALNCLPQDVVSQAEQQLAEHGICLNDKLVLVTAHRRENHGERLSRILEAVVELTERYPDHQFVLPVHPNPNVRSVVHEALGSLPNVVLTEPMDYPCLVRVMRQAKLIMTDSGGIQEEAPSFGAPVLVMRYETERQEGVDAGFAKLVGADKELILREASAVLSQPKEATRLCGENNPYGDGRASERIAEAMTAFFA